MLREIKRAIAIACLLCLTALLAACGNNDDGNKPTSAPTEAVTPTEEVTPTAEATPAEVTPTEEPTPTAEPTTTAEPSPTTAVEPTGEPEPSGEPNPTGEPEPSGEPVPSGEPEPTGEPAPSGEPEPTGEPVPSGEPEPTGEPTPTTGLITELPEKWDVSEKTLEELRVKYAQYAETQKEARLELLQHTYERTGRPATQTFLKDVIRPSELLGPQYMESLMDFWVFETWTYLDVAYEYDTEPMLICQYFLYFPENRYGVHEKRLLYQMNCGTKKLSEDASLRTGIAFNESEGRYLIAYAETKREDVDTDWIRTTYVYDRTSGVPSYTIHLEREFHTDKDGNRSLVAAKFEVLFKDDEVTQWGKFRIDGVVPLGEVGEYASRQAAEAVCKEAFEAFVEDTITGEGGDMEPVHFSFKYELQEMDEMYIFVVTDAEVKVDYLDGADWPEAAWTEK